MKQETYKVSISKDDKDYTFYVSGLDFLLEGDFFNKKLNTISEPSETHTLKEKILERLDGVDK